MAFRVRVLHFILLGLLGMSLVVYSSYYATSSNQYSVQNGELKGNNVPPSGDEAIADEKALLRYNMEQHGFNSSLQLSEEERTIVVRPIMKPVNKEAPLEKVSSVKPNSPANTPAPSAAVNSKHLSAVESEDNVFHVQRIPPRSNKEQGSLKATASNNIPVDSTEKGITTRSIYQSGYVINNSALCPDFGSSIQIVILITSAPSHKTARMAIRQTWGHYGQRSDVSIAFFLGTTLDDKIQQAISEENAMYGDLISANFIDTYNNLTLKTVSMLEWVDTYCNRTKFFMKTDDDMFINVPVLLNFIAKHSIDQKTIFGRLAKKWKPIRYKKSKYYVSPLQYRPAVFPNFTTGPAYLLTGDAIRDLYWAALDKTYLKLEDVYVTGIVAEEVKVKRVHANEFLNKRITFNPCNIQKGISIHMIKFHEQFDLWKKLLDGRSKCP